MSHQVEVAEALCSALYQMPFSEFLGEKDLPVDDKDEARFAWFHLGDHPKDMRVAVIRPKKRDEVRVKCEWRNHYSDGRQPLKGEQTFTISTYAGSGNEVRKASEYTILRVLQLFQDVLAEDGVAGQISKLQEAASASHDVNSKE